VSYLGAELAPKRLELLLEVVPKAAVIGVLENPANPRVKVAARSIGKELVIANSISERGFDTAFACPKTGRCAPSCW